MKYIINTLLLLMSLQIGTSQEWAIYFSATDIDCVTNTTCYNVLLKSSGEDFRVGSTNLRLFYNANTQKFSEENIAVSLDKNYRITNRNITAKQASLEGKGSLEFEHNMGLLNIPIDFRGTAADALTVTPFNFTPIASNICFQSVDKVSMKNPADFVWVTEETGEGYTSSYTTINNPEGTSTNLKGSSHQIETGTELRSDCGANALLSSVSNYPNPFVEQTRISYTVQHETQVNLTVYGFDGKLIHQNSAVRNPGAHYFEVTKDDLDGAGVYFYTVRTQNNTIKNRMILIK